MDVLQLKEQLKIVIKYHWIIRDTNVKINDFFKWLKPNSVLSVIPIKMFFDNMVKFSS